MCGSFICFLWPKIKVERIKSEEKFMRLPSFDESVFFDIQSFPIDYPKLHNLKVNCSDGSCPFHVDVEYDWSTREWLTPSILPWIRRKIVANEWRSFSHNSATISISLKV